MARVLKVIGNLILALLNATLILVALCLWLALQVSHSAERVVDRANEAVAQIHPVTVELQGLQDEVAGLRADLDTMATGASDQAQAAAEAAQARIDQMQAKIDAVEERLADLRTLPDQMSGGMSSDPRDEMLEMLQLGLRMMQNAMQSGSLPPDTQPAGE
ncbi:hypothetical protein [Marinibacterium profundimaris]|uniref:hypothetical protein n=1 Tax=Marinibacterium profundimaris TaxID=1679460 RepID=UPI000B524F2F|nr:hypothetical protein [Marinibacterium profundimaris]